MTVVPWPRPPATDSQPRPVVRHRHRRHAPKTAPCPHCGQPGRRKALLHRTVRSLAYQAILLIHVTTAEYRATCACVRTFRTQVDGIEPKAHYDNRVRQAVLDRILDDHLSLRQVQQALRRDFFLDLSDGFLYDGLDWKVRQLDGAAYRRWTLEQFSGTLCVDEIHLGTHTLVLATDPLGNFPVAFALVSANDQEHMGRFLRSLQAHGFAPRVVVTDGSPLYPTLLATIWPGAEHQLCIFHVLQDINESVLAAVRRLRRAWQRRGRRGRKGRGGRRRRRAAMRLREQAQFVYRRRHLIVKRRDHLSAAEQKALDRVLEVAPGLRVLRAFVDQVHQLFERSQTEATAWRRHAALHRQAAFAAVPELAEALARLSADQFDKMIAFLRQPVGRRVRTNNHVERMNRVLRRYEKGRYKWRRARTKVRFVWLLIERRWGPGRAARSAGPGAGRGRATGAKRRAEDGVGGRAPDDQQKVA